MKYKNNIITLLGMTVAMLLTSCGNKITSKTYNVIQDNKYDAVLLDTSIEDFIKSGFDFGDSCNITFSNDLKFEDIPFYSGYYVRTGLPVIVGYPGYDNISITRNNEGLWTESGLTDKDTCTVTLNEKGKYLDTQEALSQSYSINRDDYDSDIQFANFRTLSGGNLKDNFLYRGASPVDNRKNRAGTVDGLLEDNGIRFVLDLADSIEEYLSYREDPNFVSNYASSLYDEDNVALLSMSSNYGSDLYKTKLASGLKKMITKQGPIYVHCLEGKDRTGFVCLLLEGLAGASYEEMRKDYMKTYDNYYGINEDDSPNKYKAISDLYFEDFTSYLSYLHGTNDLHLLTSADFTTDVVNYLLSAGMTRDQITSLRNMITKE